MWIFVPCLYDLHTLHSSHSDLRPLVAFSCYFVEHSQFSFLHFIKIFFLPIFTDVSVCGGDQSQVEKCFGMMSLVHFPRPEIFTQKEGRSSHSSPLIFHLHSLGNVIVKFKAPTFVVLEETTFNSRFIYFIFLASFSTYLQTSSNCVLCLNNCHTS